LPAPPRPAPPARRAPCCAPLPPPHPWSCTTPPVQHSTGQRRRGHKMELARGIRHIRPTAHACLAICDAPRATEQDPKPSPRWHHLRKGLSPGQRKPSCPGRSTACLRAVENVRHGLALLVLLQAAQLAQHLQEPLAHGGVLAARPHVGTQVPPSLRATSRRTCPAFAPAATKEAQGSTHGHNARNHGVTQQPRHGGKRRRGARSSACTIGAWCRGRGEQAAVPESPATDPPQLQTPSPGFPRAPRAPPWPPGAPPADPLQRWWAHMPAPCRCLACPPSCPAPQDWDQPERPPGSRVTLATCADISKARRGLSGVLPPLPAGAAAAAALAARQMISVTTTVLPVPGGP